MGKALLGKTILITRPEGQNQKLCELLSEQGAKVIAFPTIAIQPLESSSDCSNLSEFDVAIFTSVNAVKFSVPQLLQSHKVWPKKLKVAAIGNSTKKVLEDYDLPCHYIPASNFSSESLLKLAEFQHLNGKKILIVTGANGRLFLQEALKARGATIEKLFCYQRKVPNYPASAIIRLSELKIDVIVCTSNSSLKNLAGILGKPLASEYKSMQIIGFSARIIPLATQLGFTKTPIITAEASDESVLTAMLNELKGTGYGR